MRMLPLAISFLILSNASTFAKEVIIGRDSHGQPIIKNIDIGGRYHGWYATLCEGDGGYQVEKDRIIANPNTPAQKIHQVSDVHAGYLGAANEGYGVEAGGKTFVFEPIKKKGKMISVMYDEEKPKDIFPRCK